ADTLNAYLRILRALQPRAFLLENVYGLVYKGKDEGMRHLRDQIERMNKELGTSYSFEWRMLNCVHYGVPQIRERIFIVGYRDGTRFSFPEPTHAEPDGSRSSGTLFDVTCEPWLTAWDAIGDLQDESS